MKKRHVPKVMVFISVCLLAVGISILVGKNKKPTPLPSVPPKQVPQPPSPTVVNPPVLPHNALFRSFKTESMYPGAELAKEVGSTNVQLVLAFNRLDAEDIQRGTVFTVPTVLDDWDALSPFPESLPEVGDVSKLLLVSQRVQAFGAYESGKLVRWGTVSTGKADTPTPSRLYTMNWKGKLVVSSVKEEWILPWYFNLDNMGGISLHQYALPGYPASHSCIRLSESDAKWVYDWADQWILAPDEQTELAAGTPVIVFGEYTYGKTAPWKRLPVDPNATTITAAELAAAITPELDAIHEKARERALVEKSNP